MKQCLLIIGVILAYLSSFANEMTSYAPRDYSPIANSTTTRTYIGEWERIDNSLSHMPTGTGNCDIYTRAEMTNNLLLLKIVELYR